MAAQTDEVLTGRECHALLSAQYLARLAFRSADGRLTILPVNIAVDHDGSVVFQSEPGSKLDAAVRRDEAALEVDGVDEEYHAGWSVVVHGQLEAVTERGEVRRLDLLPVRPWRRGSGEFVWIRLVPDAITGRKIP